MSQSQLSNNIAQGLPLGAKLFLNVLQKIKVGHCQLITPQGAPIIFGDAHQKPAATLKINDWRACKKILSAGDIGLAECIELNWVESPDLTALLRLAIQNENTMQRVVNGGGLATYWYRLKHFLRPNTREGSRKNIHAHYDLGNDFYSRWLDKSWTYSSAFFKGDLSLDLELAQGQKYQRIIDQLGLQAGDHVLEVGCGWGGFALHAAKQGIRVTGITISQAQLEVAQLRIKEADLTALVDLCICDYRDIKTQFNTAFDAIVSIEMFEAVGERYWQDYFYALSQNLKPNGRAMVQTITIAERDFLRYRSSTDFIQQYIFPGGMLPSVSRFVKLAQTNGLSVEQECAFGKDYAETLRRWRHRWESAYDDIMQLGFDERFMRIWRLYFAYCEAGFDEGKTDVVQFLMVKN